MGWDGIEVVCFVVVVVCVYVCMFCVCMCVCRGGPGDYLGVLLVFV